MMVFPHQLSTVEREYLLLNTRILYKPKRQIHVLELLYEYVSTICCNLKLLIIFCVYIITAVLSMLFYVVLVVIGLCHVTLGDVDPFCMTDTPDSADTNNDYFQLDVAIPQVGTYDLRTYKKFTTYSGKLFVL